MKSLIATCALAATFAAPAFAADTQDMERADTLSNAGEYADALISTGETELEAHHNRAARQRLREICSKVELTDEQKPLVKDAIFDYKEAAIQLKADLKTAKLQFVRLILDEGADAQSAVSAVSDGVTAKTALAQAKGDLATNLFFTILTAEQRKPALKCLMAWKKVKEHRRGGSHGDH